MADPLDIEAIKAKAARGGDSWDGEKLALVAEVERLREALVETNKSWVDESRFLRDRIMRLNEDIVDMREGRSD